MDFYQSFTIIEHTHPLTDFQNARIMEIHGTNDESWSDLWNDELRRSLIELSNLTIYRVGTSQTIYTITNIYCNLKIKQIINSNLIYTIIYVYMIFGHPCFQIGVIDNHAYPFYDTSLRICTAISMKSKVIGIKDTRTYILKFVR